MIGDNSIFNFVYCALLLDKLFLKQIILTTFQYVIEKSLCKTSLSIVRKDMFQNNKNSSFTSASSTLLFDKSKNLALLSHMAQKLLLSSFKSYENICVKTKKIPDKMFLRILKWSLLQIQYSQSDIDQHGR